MESTCQEPTKGSDTFFFGKLQGLLCEPLLHCSAGFQGPEPGAGNPPGADALHRKTWQKKKFQAEVCTMVRKEQFVILEVAC